MPKVAKPRKKGNRWEINFIGPDGLRKFETYRMQSEAVRALRYRNVESEEVRNGFRKEFDRSRTFEDLVKLWLEVKHRKRSLRDDEIRIEKHLKPVLSGVPVVEINASWVTKIERASTKKGLSVQMIAHNLGLIRAMLRLAVEHEWIPAAPRVRLPKPVERAYVWLENPDDQRRLLIAASETNYPGLMELYATALYTGMRAGELCGLRWSDVDLEHRLITVQRSFATPTKSSKIRRVPIFDPLLPVLREWKARCGSRELVFPNEVGKMHARGARACKQLFVECRTKAKIPKVRFHDLRHSFASRFMLAGGDLFKLQKILGHQSIVMTQRYAHLSPEAFKEDLGRLDDVLPRETPAVVIAVGNC
jgi:integrase